MNEFGENNNNKNNPKSIASHSLNLLFDNDNRKRQSLLVSKNNNISEINKINNKIKIKNKDIENMKRLIEIAKNKIIKTNLEIKNVCTLIEIKEKERDDLQQAINYLNNYNIY